MTARFVVMVTDPDDARHGEITVLEDRKQAERLIETLLEAGSDQERIRVLTGAEIQMQVSHRPIVSLEAHAALLSENLPPPKPSAEAGESPGAAPWEEPQLEDAEPANAPFVQNGVRFSSLFRPS
jgi:hypothetical protein